MNILKLNRDAALCLLGRQLIKQQPELGKLQEWCDADWHLPHHHEIRNMMEEGVSHNIFMASGVLSPIWVVTLSKIEGGGVKRYAFYAKERAHCLALGWLFVARNGNMNLGYDEVADLLSTINRRNAAFNVAPVSIEYLEEVSDCEYS